MKEKRNNRGSGKGRTEAGLPAYSSWLARATTSLYICNNLSPVAFSLGLQALSQGKNETRTSQRGPVFIYIFFIIIYIISTHIRLIHTYPYTSNLFKTIQNCSKPKNPKGIDVVMAFPWPHLPFLCLGGWSPGRIFRFGATGAGAGSSCASHICGQDTQPRRCATWRMFWCILEHAIDDVRNTFHLLKQPLHCEAGV